MTDPAPPPEPTGSPEPYGAAGAAEPTGSGRTDEGGWQRLDPRNKPVAALFIAGPPVVVGLLWLVGGAFIPPGLLWTITSLGVTGVVIGVVAAVEWVTVRYRVTGERLQVRTGFAVRNHRSIPRDRIRSVDISASPLHRVFGLATVKVGTGQHVGSGNEELKLDGVSPAEAERLRAVLLYRTAQEGTAEKPAAEPEEPAVARLNWAWLRYAPLTMSSLLAVFGALGVLYKPLDAMGVKPADIIRLGVVRGAVGEFRTVPLWLAIAVLVLVVVLVAVLGAALLFVLTWYGFRLDDEGATLRTRRGLLTTRSVTLEKRRLRGVEVAEPLLLRAGGGARLNVVAVGLSTGKGESDRDKDSNARALLPPAPRAEAHRVAVRVLGDDPTADVALRPHPRAARRRRINRAVLTTLAVAVVLAVLGVWWLPAWAWLCALVLLPVLLPFSYDAYRSLGHGVTGRYLVTRYGTGIRRTVGLRRDGVIGWTVSRSPFQRRAGLVTLTATTAANDGAYKVRDVDPATALRLAEEAVPGMLAPFLADPPGRADGTKPDLGLAAQREDN